jgi:hypothetical protein
MVVGKQLGLTKQKNQFTFANFEKCWGIVYAKIERFGEQKRYDSYQKM